MEGNSGKEKLIRVLKPKQSDSQKIIEDRNRIKGKQNNPRERERERDS